MTSDGGVVPDSADRIADLVQRMRRYWDGVNDTFSALAARNRLYRDVEAFGGTVAGPCDPALGWL